MSKVIGTVRGTSAERLEMHKAARKIGVPLSVYMRIKLGLPMPTDFHIKVFSDEKKEDKEATANR